MKTAAVANQKGGVGKTAISCHHALSLAEQGYRVLFIDNDPQGNSTYSLKKSELTTVAPFQTLQMYESNPLPPLDPKTPITLVGADRLLSKVARFETEAPFLFKEHLQKMSGDFDYCVIDNPPTLGLGLIAALVSADFVYSPVELEDFSVAGLNDLMGTINAASSRHNPTLEYLGIIPNRLNSHDARQKEKFKKLLAAFPGKVIKAAIVQRGSISEALERGLPIWALQKEKSAARKATQEIRVALDFIEEKMGCKKRELEKGEV